MRFFSFSLTLAITLTTAVAGLATTIHVPGDYGTIQAGINASVDGDTVLVAAGIYSGTGNRDITFGGRAIVVMSEDGPDVTIVDCGESAGSPSDPHRGFDFVSGEDETSVLQGFTIRNGFVFEESGGAILCFSSSPTLRGNIIVDNRAGLTGGEDSGGGISCVYASSPIIVDNVIRGNTAVYTGGGIFCYLNSSPTIRGNIISENSSFTGGGINISYGSMPLIEENLITNNFLIGTEGGAGGIICYGSSSPVIRRNTITGNRSNNAGGGIVCQWSSSPSIVGNTIAGNTAAKRGGGIYSNYGSSPTIWNNTIVDNAADSLAGGLYFSIDSHPTVMNSILWNNSAPMGKEVYLGDTGDPSSLTISYSDVEGGQESIFLESGCTLNWGDGMIDVDPSFVYPDRWDYRLLWESGCIDAGCPDSLDIDGTVCDIGAHCFNQNDYLTIYLTPDTYEVGHGSWTGITYTAINRQSQPEAFWLLTQVILPGGRTEGIQGPQQYTLPAQRTARVYVSYPVKDWLPVGMAECRSWVGIRPGTLYDEDHFTFLVTE